MIRLLICYMQSIVSLHYFYIQNYIIFESIPAQTFSVRMYLVSCFYPIVVGMFKTERLKRI